MGIFSSIKNAIFGKDDDDKAKEAPKAGPTSAALKNVAQSATAKGVDVEARLAAMDGADKLNWRTSIVDLLKLLGIDSSYANRKQLATELGDTSYEGSADDNIRLHKRTMRELEKNGGRVPASMLD